MALLRDFASLAVLCLSLTAFYVCASSAAPANDDEGPAVPVAAPTSDNAESGQHSKHASTPSETRADRVRRGAKEWDLPERGRERRNDDEEDGSPLMSERRERRGSKHFVDRRSGDPWGDYDSLERGRERRRSLSVNHELASLADMLQDSSKQRKLNKLKTLREEYGKRSANYHTGHDDDEAEVW